MQINFSKHTKQDEHTSYRPNRNMSGSVRIPKIINRC